MADIYFRKAKAFAGEYFQLYGLKNVKPTERSALGFDCQEYMVICGDISQGPEQVNAQLKKMRDSWQEQGHTLHFK